VGVFNEIHQEKLKTVRIKKMIKKISCVGALKNVEWNRFFNLVDSLGGQLDSRKNRFDKADLLEAALEEFSNGAFVWVDEIGHDHITTFDRSKLEMKSQKNCLSTDKRQQKKLKTSSIKLTNTLSKTVDTQMDITADYLLLVDTQSYAAAVVPYALAVEKATRVPDGFCVQLEATDLHYVFTPDEYEQPTKKNINLCEQKQQMYRDIIAQF